MSKTDQFNNIVKDYPQFFPYYIYDDDKKAEQEAASLIRELRQIIERLRRIVETNHSL